jgi:hypothetical protein
MARKSHTEGGSNLRFSWHLRWRVINMNCMVAAHYREGAHGEVVYLTSNLTAQIRPAIPTQTL